MTSSGATRRLYQEPQALGFLEVPVEVAGEDPLEAAVLERQRERVALNERRARAAPVGHAQHRLAGVQPDDLAGQPPGDEAGAAADVECPSSARVR